MADKSLSIIKHLIIHVIIIFLISGEKSNDFSFLNKVWISYIIVRLSFFPKSLLEFWMPVWINISGNSRCQTIRGKNDSNFKPFRLLMLKLEKLNSSNFEPSQSYAQSYAPDHTSFDDFLSHLKDPRLFRTGRNYTSNGIRHGVIFERTR